MKRAMILAAICGCSAPAATTPPEPPARSEAAPPPAIQAENPQWERILREAMAGRSAEEQQMATLSQKHYEIALAYFNRGDFERAKTESQEAVRIWPEHIPARRLLSTVCGLIIGGPETPRAIGEAAAREALVATEQAQLEIQMHLVHGDRYFTAKMYESAAREYENAEFKILHLPYDVKAMNELLPKVREGLRRSKSSIRD